jgi:hypothetical protein
MDMQMNRIQGMIAAYLQPGWPQCDIEFDLEFVMVGGHRYGVIETRAAWEPDDKGVQWLYTTTRVWTSDDDELLLMEFKILHNDEPLANEPARPDDLELGA